jgi:sugar O-acyltransferase (sialic acid O-acetyltransferase NeuD family)
MNEPLYIIGAGGHATSVAEIAFAANLNLQAFISPDSAAAELMGIPILATIPQQIDPKSIKLAIAIGDNYQRESVFNNLKDQFQIESFPALIHPSASVALSAVIGFGCTVHQHAAVGSNSVVGNFCTLNTGSNTDHDCRLSDFSSLGPGADLGGNVNLGTRSAIAIGATVRHGLSIGSDSILGAASYAHSDIAGNKIAFGSPAHVVRSRTTSEKYL